MNSGSTAIWLVPNTSNIWRDCIFASIMAQCSLRTCPNLRKAPMQKKKSRGRHQPKGLTILHEDRDILVVDKAPGLLTMGTNREKVKTAYCRLTDYVRKGNPKSHERVYIVHRLDREVSGVLVFARSMAAKKALQAQWAGVEKHYLALVHGVPLQSEGTFSSYLVESGVHRVHPTKNPKQGKLSSTAYKVLGTSQGVSLLEIKLLTGRKHQIRVHLAERGLPIVGDKKYGEERSGPKRLALHAKSIAFKHPHSGETCFFETRTPSIFLRVPIRS